jgi:hypothetical protein
MDEVSLNDLGLARFSGLLGSGFKLYADRVALPDLTLVEATPFRRPACGDSEPESFSLVFTGPANRQLEQAMYRFEHERIGAFELFIVPIGSNGVVVRYEAVINRSHR